MKFYFTIFLLVLFLLGCGADIKKTSAFQSGNGLTTTETYTGLDINGNSKTCSAVPMGLACTMLYGTDEEFADNCQKSGKVAYACACHSYICMDKK
jgi:hypothetical protein